MNSEIQTTQNLWQKIPAGSNPPEEINCVVEIPKGSTNKYEYANKWGAFRLDRVLDQTVSFPTEYGFIPGTWNEKDDDPLDIMVLATFPTFSGCIISCRPIGVIKIVDTGEEDDKILAVALNDPHFEQIKNLTDLPSHIKKEITNFCENYAQLQPEKEIKVEGWADKQEAKNIISQTVEAYEKKFRNSA